MQAWGLENMPFSRSGAETVFFAGTPQQEALSRMRFLVLNGRRLGLVLGQSGSGKSLLAELFEEECCKENWTVARLNLVGMSVQDFHWQLAVGLRAAPRVADESPRLERRWHERLVQNRLQDERTVLLLDDADQAGADVLTQLVRTVQLPVSQVGSLTMVLTASSDQAHRLGKRLLDLVHLRIDLEPWDEADMVAYLQLALVEAGAEQPVFNDAALAEIHRLSGGVPRQVNRLADLALVAGRDAEPIDKRSVAEVYASLTSRK